MKTIVDNPNEARESDASPPVINAAGKQTPRRMRRAAEIIAASRETFLDKGFEKALVSEIAAKVGVVEGLLYSYFPTKRDLLNEVLRGMYEPLIHEVEDGFSRLQGLRSRLRFLIWRHLRVFVEEPGLSRLVLHEVRTRPEYFNSTLHELHLRYTKFLMYTIRDAVAFGELPEETDGEMIRGMVYGGIEHRMWGVLLGRDTVNVEVAADSFTDMVLHGILPHGYAETPAAASSPEPFPSSRKDIERRLERLEKIVTDGVWPSTAAAGARRKKIT